MLRLVTPSIRDLRRTFLLGAAIILAVLGSAVEAGHPSQAQVSRHALEALLGGTGFARIPAGEFLMGSGSGAIGEGPVHRVRISKVFEMGKFEVTQAQWDAVMRGAHKAPERGTEKADPNIEATPSYFKGASRPVEKVSWNDVQRFLAALNVRDVKYLYRLPTEAEWEYASKAGRREESAKDLDRLAWFKANAEGGTHPVGEKEANPWGLHDMQGNVSEWVQDWYDVDYYDDSPAVDPRGPESGSYRIFRGCSWFGSAADCRSALRLYNFPIDGYYNVGFRLVRTPK